MSRHLAFRRQPVDPQVAMRLQTTTFPAPTRGLIMSENQAYMQPGGAIVQDNWVSTMRGVKLRGGSIRWCDLFPGLPVPSPSRKPVISAFDYISGTNERMFAATQTALFDVTSSTPSVVKSGQRSGNYAATQLSNEGANWMLAVNDAGDPPLRFNGATWATLDPAGAPGWRNNTHYTVGSNVRDPDDSTFWSVAVDHTSSATGTFSAERTAHPTYWQVGAGTDGVSLITGPPDSNVVDGRNLSYIWKYRNRLFFIEKDSMNAWYLGTDAVGGELSQIPLSGSASGGGNLIFGAVWSLDAGDGADDKCVFVTTLGELLIFTGTDPGDPDNWRQEGRYQMSPPLGMNAHITIGGDLLIATVDGITPTSQAITKNAGQLELAMLTRTIKPLWREQARNKRGSPWTIKKWDEFGAIFVAASGGGPGDRFCLVANNATGAWCRFVGYDATCFIKLREDFFFGTQDGIIMQADRTGYDDGNHMKIPYVATLVGGWETFGAPSAQIVWHQSRAVFITSAIQNFNPQLSVTTDYLVTIPPPPTAGIGSAIGDDLWDVGKWGPPGGGEEYLQWDGGVKFASPVRSTMWVSIGRTGYAHAPITQVTVAQDAKPEVELVAVSTVHTPAGVNVD
jgi:hypothetical protein